MEKKAQCEKTKSTYFCWKTFIIFQKPSSLYVQNWVKNLGEVVCIKEIGITYKYVNEENHQYNLV